MRLDDRISRHAAMIHQQQHWLTPCARDRLPVIAHVPDRLVIDFLDHIAATDGRLRRRCRAGRIHGCNYHAVNSRAQVELLRNLGSEFINSTPSSPPLLSVPLLSAVSVFSGNSPSATV